MLVGSEAECELSCEKLRAEDVVKAAASGGILEVLSGLELRISPEAVVAASRVRDAIWIMVELDASDDDVGHAKLQSHRRIWQPSPTVALCNLPIPPPETFLPRFQHLAFDILLQTLQLSQRQFKCKLVHVTILLGPVSILESLRRYLHIMFDG